MNRLQPFSSSSFGRAWGRGRWRSAGGMGAQLGAESLLERVPSEEQLDRFDIVARGARGGRIPGGELQVAWHARAWRR